MTDKAVRHGRAAALTREAGVAVLFVTLTILMTWPLAAHLSTAIAQPDDPLALTWVLDWDYYATTHGRALFDANIFYPARWSLAFSEHMYGIAIFTFPLFALGLAPLIIHNIALLAGFAASGYAMYLLARSVTASTPAALIGGIAFAFTGIRFHHLPHLPYICSMWLPVILLSSLGLIRTVSWQRSAIFAGALIMNGLTALHWLVFGSVAGAITLLVFGYREHHFHNSRFWVYVAASFFVAGIVLAPFLLPYTRVSRLYGMHRSYAEVLTNGARWRDWFVPNLQSKLYGGLSAADSYGHERTLFPGLVTYALAAMAFLRAPISRNRWTHVIDAAISLAAVAAIFGGMAGDVSLRWRSHNLLAYSGAAAPLIAALILITCRLAIEPPRWTVARIGTAAGAAVLWVVLGAWGARGLYGVFHTFLYEHSSAFRGIRMPARWAMIAYVGLALLAAIGAARVLNGRRRTATIALTLLIAAAQLIELRAAPIRWFLLPVEKRDVYRWLASLSPDGAVAELPMTQPLAYTYLWRATEHHQRLINGVSSYTPPRYQDLQAAYDGTPISNSFLNQLETLGCSLVVVHADALGERRDVVRQWLQQSIAVKRLSFVRRFDSETRGDWVFAVTRNERNATRWRAQESPDPSGRTPSQNASAFLAGLWTYSAQPLASVDVGPPIGTTRGKLTISGWALAPAGVRSVNLRFGNGTVVVHADRFERQDVKQLLPWYLNDPQPGFYKTFDAPPASVRGDTDMQIEVIDARGASLRMQPFWFRWLPASQNRIIWNEQELARLLDRLGANAVANHDRLISGSAAIHDLTPVLQCDSETETDLAFTRRVLDTLLPAASDHLMNRCLAMLTSGTSRERVIQTILRTQEFAQRYIRQGEVVID